MGTTIENWEANMKENATLVGGFCCRLTAAERNEWAVFIEGFPVYAEHLDAHAQLCRVVAQGDEAQVTNAVREESRTRRAIYAISEEWYAGVLARRAASAEASK